MSLYMCIYACISAPSHRAGELYNEKKIKRIVHVF